MQANVAGNILTSEERQQAQAEGLTLLVAGNKAGYFGVYTSSSKNKLGYLAQVRRGGKRVSLGSFATAGEAALCVARSPEGQAGTATALAPPLVNKEDSKGVVPSGAILKEEGAVPPMPLGAFVKNEEVAPPMPPGAYFKEEDDLPTPLDAVVEEEHGVVVKEEERSDDQHERGAEIAECFS